MLNLKMLVSTLIFSLISLNNQIHGQKLVTDLMKSKCKTGCNKFFNILDPPPKIEIPSQKEYTLKLKKCRKEVKTYYMFRRKYAAIVKQAWGNRPIFNELKDVPVSKEEAIRWAEKSKCSIGKICPPNGDCWGSDTDLCRNDAADEWVDEREMQFAGMTWSASFHQACTMDWSCSTKINNNKVIINKEGYPVTYIDGKEIQLEENAPTQFFEMQGYSIFINERLGCSEVSVKANCFTDADTLYCERKLGNSNAIYITINMKEGCSYWGHESYCINMEENIENKGKAEDIPTMNDLNEIASSIRTINKIINKNFFMLMNQNNNIKEKINTLIMSLLKTNPLLLSSFLDKSTYSRWIEGNIVEICPCLDLPSCQERENHVENIRFCSPGADGIVGNVTLFDESSGISKIDDIHYEFVGKDINIITDHLEEETLANHQYSSDQKNGMMDVINSYFSPWHYLLEYSGIIALAISVYNVLVLRRK